MNVYAITPTGARPAALQLLGEYLNRQTYRGELTWLVIDDCDPASPLPKVRTKIDLRPIRPSWRWAPKMNTQIQSMRVGLLQVPADAALFVLEDDDIYLPGHIENLLGALQDFELVGERDARYYNIRTGKSRVLPGKVHASLAATACRGKALAKLKALCASNLNRMLDFKLWQGFNGPKQLLTTHNVIGVKGLPGRPGIGVGHANSFGSVDIDNTLQRWAGDYAENYGEFRRAV